MTNLTNELAALIPEGIDSTYITRCFICGLPLKDSDSVDCGIGPVCRKKGGYNHLSKADRADANVVLRFLSWRESSGDLSVGDLLVWGDWLLEAGLENIFHRAAKRFAVLTLEARNDGARFFISTRAYDGGFLSQMYRVVPSHERTFERVSRKKGFAYDMKHGRAMWTLLCERFGGQIGIDADGKVFELSGAVHALMTMPALDTVSALAKLDAMLDAASIALTDGENDAGREALLTLAREATRVADAI